MSPTTNRVVFALLGMVASKVLAVLPIDYWAVFGGGYIAKYIVAPPVVALVCACWFFRQPPDRRAALVDKFDRAVTCVPDYPRIAVFGLAGLVLTFYLPVAWEFRPAPMEAGRGSVPPAMASRPEFVFYLPIPDRLPPPQTVERKLPPKKKMLDSKLFPMESMLAQLPVAPRVDYPTAPEGEAPKPVTPSPPTALRLVAP